MPETIELLSTSVVDSDVMVRSDIPLTDAVVTNPADVVTLRVASPVTDGPDTSNPNPSIVT